MSDYLTPATVGKMKALSQATVFYVSDLVRSLEFYTKKLGFGKDFVYGDPVYYAGIELDEISIHLCKPNCCPEKIGKGSVYVFCDSVDDHFEKVKSAGVELKKELETHPHGMKEFCVIDPDGNYVSFGTKI